MTDRVSLPGPSPLVSVIVPTFNRPEDLLEAVRSIEAQTFRDFEIIVVNDCGVDVAPLLASGIEAGYLRYFRHDKNQGLAAARNTGLRAARGRYINYLDDDDIFYPQHLETLLTAFRDPACFVAYTDSYRADQVLENGVWKTVRRAISFKAPFNADRFLVQNYIPVLCIMHRRECLDACGYFDEAFRSHEDFELWLRFSRIYSFVHIEQFTSEYRWREVGLCSNTRRMIETIQQVYRKHPVDPDAMPVIWMHRHRHIETWLAEELTGRAALMASIIICFHDDWDRTVHCLNSLFNHAREGLYEIILVDDGSSGGSKAIASKTPGLLHYLRNPRPVGLAAARNQGAKMARGPYLVFLDPRTEVTKGWLEYLLAAAENDVEAGAIGSKVVRPDGKLESAGAMVFQDGDQLLFGTGDNPDKPIYALPAEADYCPSTGLLVRKSAFEEVGGFDEACAPSYADADFCFTVRRAGHKILYQPHSVLFYQPGPDSNDKLAGPDQARNLFRKKWREELALLPPSPRVTGKISLTPSRGRNRFRLSQPSIKSAAAET